MIITFTGADDKTNVEDLIKLRAAHVLTKPLRPTNIEDIEFGILLGNSNGYENGMPRYPSISWIKSLPESLLNLSLHLCGQYVSDILKTKSTIHSQSWLKKFKRIQLNLGYRYLGWAIEELNYIESLADEYGKEIILGGPWELDKYPIDTDNVSFMFDPSGGKGVESTWPVPSSGKWGIAGGLGPDIGVDTVNWIKENKPCWIDMETKIRNTSDQFDINLCQKVLGRLS